MRWCKATDPRDKVYGLLGVATRTGSLVADYSKDVSTVYMETARALIAEHETLEILSIEKCSTSVINLQSWAPDWSKERDKNQGLPLGDRRVDGKDKFLASAGRKPITAPGSIIRELKLKDFIVDSIATVYEEYVPELSEFLVLDYAIKLLEIPRHIRLDNTYLFTGEEITVAYQITLCADLLPTPNRTEAWQDEILSDFGTASTRASSANKERPLMGPGLLQQFYATIFRVTQGRHFFITERGYIGLATATAQRGDSVAVLLGGDVPYTLRSKGQAYELIGECYVHGIMDGEAVNDFDKVGKDFDKIVLV